MRGVSERVRGRAGWAAESSRGVPPFSGRPGTRPASRSPRRGEAAAGASRCPPPQQLAAARGAANEEGRGCRERLAAAGPSKPSLLTFGLRPRGAAAEGRGPQGGRPAALEEPQEQKETATAPPWSKQPALAAAQGRAAASESSALTPSLPRPLPCAWPQAIGLAGPTFD